MSPGARRLPICLPFFRRVRPDYCAERPGAFLVPAIVADIPIAVEYALSWDHLQFRLEKEGLDQQLLLRHVARGAVVNQSSSDQQEEEQAAVLFRVAADTESTAADGQDARFAVARLTQPEIELFRAILTQDNALGRISARAVLSLTVPWVRVYDGRPESVLRRASRRPTEQLARTRILLLGCGGLGAPIAEHCARSAWPPAHRRLGDGQSRCPVPTALRRRGHRQAEGDRSWRTGSRPAARTARSPRQSTTQPRPTCSACLNWPTTT